MRAWPARELRGLIPGMPGSHPSSEPCTSSTLRPRRPSTESRSGIQGASPTTVVTAGCPATAMLTAPPIEKPTRAAGRPGRAAASRAASPSAMHISRRFQDFTR